MQHQRLAIAAVGTAVFIGGTVAPAKAGSPDPSPITVTDGAGFVDTTVSSPGSTGGLSGGPAGQPAISRSSGAAGVSCTYVLDIASPSSDVPSIPPIHQGDSFAGEYYFRNCSDGTASLVWVPFAKAGAAAAAAPAGVAVVTSAQLAQEALDRMPLTRPTVRRSPTESNDYQGDPFTWANLWTWVWADPASYRPIIHTVSVGRVSATVVARPMGLVFEPGDGGDPVHCPGPGRPWTEADGNTPPAVGCGYQYRHVTAGTVTSRLGIEWKVSWTGTGGLDGTLPTMQTMTDAPLRVLQIQVVNK